MNERYRTSKSEYARILELEKESGVGKTTIQRVLSPERHEDHDVGLGTLTALAMALRIEVQDLFEEQ